MSGVYSDDGWPDPRKRPPGGDVGSVLDERAAAGRSNAGPPTSRHPYLTLVLMGPVVTASLFVVGLGLSGAWSTLIASPILPFLVVLGILLPLSVAVVFHRRGRSRPPHPHG